MLSVNMTVDLWATAGDFPAWDGDNLRVRDGDVEVVLHLTGDDRAEWCTRFAYSLLAKAEELQIDRRQARRYAADAAAMIADLRRDKGEIADDGWCWDCKADNHEGHRDYNEGRCYGCACYYSAATSPRTSP